MNQQERHLQELFDRLTRVVENEPIEVDEIEEDGFLYIKSSVYTGQIEKLVEEFSPRCWFSKHFGLIIY